MARSAVAVDARTLWAAYDANEVAADNQYKGRKLLVTGVVSRIDKDFMDNIVIGLRTGNMFQDVRAKMNSSSAGQAATLSKRTNVVLLCDGSGRIMGSQTVDNCTFQ